MKKFPNTSLFPRDKRHQAEQLALLTEQTRRKLICVRKKGKRKREPPSMNGTQPSSFPRNSTAGKIVQTSA